MEAFSLRPLFQALKEVSMLAKANILTSASPPHLVPTPHPTATLHHTIPTSYTIPHHTPTPRPPHSHTTPHSPYSHTTPISLPHHTTPISLPHHTHLSNYNPAHFHSFSPPTPPHPTPQGHCGLMLLASTRTVLCVGGEEPQGHPVEPIALPCYSAGSLSAVSDLPPRA